MFFLKILTVKYFSPGGILPPPYGKSIAPIHTKIMYDLTIAIIDKCFEFQNNWFKIIRMGYYCKQIFPIPLCCRNQKFRTTSELLERYAPKSNQRQIISRCNWIWSFINYRSLVLEIQCPQNFEDILTDRDIF